MPIDPVKIPQNVNIEDRIIGPVTLRHLILLMLGGGISYFLWTILKRSGFVGLSANRTKPPRPSKPPSGWA